MDDEAIAEEVRGRRAEVARRLLFVLPAFGRWASEMRDFETPYGKAGIRQLEVLYMLRHGLLDPAVPAATALSQVFDIQRSVVTRVLAKLEAAGYIERSTHPTDGRAWQIRITETGQRLSDYVEQQYIDELHAALGELDAADTAALERAADILASAAARLGRREPALRLGRAADPA